MALEAQHLLEQPEISFSEELHSLKQEILSQSEGRDQNKKPSKEKILLKLQDAMRIQNLFDQPKVFIGGSSYNTINKFKQRQGSIQVTSEGTNNDGTYKYSLSSWGKTTRFDYNPITNKYYIMPKGKPENKVYIYTESMMLKLTNILNFAKYMNQNDHNNTIAPYEVVGSEIRKGTNYLFSMIDVDPEYDIIMSNNNPSPGETIIINNKHSMMKSIALYLNMRKQSNENIK